MPDLIRHPVPFWIPAFAGMTILRYLIAEVICGGQYKSLPPTIIKREMSTPRIGDPNE